MTREEAIHHLRRAGYTLTEIYSAAAPHSWRKPSAEDRLNFARLGGRTV